MVCQSSDRPYYYKAGRRARRKGSLCPGDPANDAFPKGTNDTTGLAGDQPL